MAKYMSDEKVAREGIHKVLDNYKRIRRELYRPEPKQEPKPEPEPEPKNHQYNEQWVKEAAAAMEAALKLARKREEQQRALQRLNAGFPKSRHQILMEVSLKHDIEPHILISHQRPRWIVQARRELYWRLRTEMLLSYPEIGRFCNRDHTTVLWGVRRWQAEVAKKKETG